VSLQEPGREIYAVTTAVDTQATMENRTDVLVVIALPFETFDSKL
jgi:hypothetical protein